MKLGKKQPFVAKWNFGLNTLTKNEIWEETAICRKLKFWPQYSSVSSQNWNWGQNAAANVLPLFSFKTYLIALKNPKIKLRTGQKPDGEQTNRKGL